MSKNVSIYKSQASALERQAAALAFGATMHKNYLKCDTNWWDALMRKDGIGVSCLIVTGGYATNIFVGYGLVDIYAKCGMLEESQCIFYGMPRKNSVSWSALIGVFAQNGRGAEGVRIFEAMIDEGVKPDYISSFVALGSDKKVGLWRIIVVHNVPYADSRRNGRVLERFLWRHNATYAISKHYTRFDVLEEAEANKAGMEYDNSSIDHQIEFL